MPLNSRALDAYGQPTGHTAETNQQLQLQLQSTPLPTGNNDNTEPINNNIRSDDSATPPPGDQHVQRSVMPRERRHNRLSGSRIHRNRGADNSRERDDEDIELGTMLLSNRNSDSTSFQAISIATIPELQTGIRNNSIVHVDTDYEPVGRSSPNSESFSNYVDSEMNLTSHSENAPVVRSNAENADAVYGRHSSLATRLYC